VENDLAAAIDLSRKAFTGDEAARQRIREYRAGK
jgi:hypothetical protein